MTFYRSDTGITAAILHFLLGSVCGVSIFGFTSWFFFAPTIVISIALTGAAIMGVCAAIWRSRFWTALANNPLFWAWRALKGGQ